MMLLQFQFTNTTQEEREVIPDFCEWLCDILFSKINTKINRKKISLRLNYILEQVNWINWGKNKYSLSTSDIIDAIYESITYKQYKDNIWKIFIDTNILIPYSYTSIDRLIRFINYGDNKQRGTGIFPGLEQDYNFKQLNGLWEIYCMKNLNSSTDVKIITR